MVCFPGTVGPDSGLVVRLCSDTESIVEHRTLGDEAIIYVLSVRRGSLASTLGTIRLLFLV